MGCSASDPQVVLVNSNQWKPAIAPLALDYLGAALEAKGIPYDLLDLCPARDPHRAIREFFGRCRPRIVAISFRNLDDVLFGLPFLGDLTRIVGWIRAESPSSTIVLGGSGFSIAPEKVLERTGVELGVWGEGEEALPMLCERLGDESAYPAIPGLVYRGTSGWVRNPQGAMPMDRFTVAGTSRRALRLYARPDGIVGSVGVQTKRGCGQRCAYCVVPNVEGACCRLRPPGMVVDEIEEAASLGARRFFIADSEFNEPAAHAMAICEEIIRRGLQERIAWTAYTSCVEFPPELASLMKHAGCDFAICSFDSASDDILERLGKRHRQADVPAAIAAAKQADLPTAYCLMVGAPGETLETFEKTIELLKRNQVKRVSWMEPQGIRIYPETRMADIVLEEGFSAKNPNLWGPVKGNEDLLRPVYYISAGLGPLRAAIVNWRRLGRTYYGVFPKTRYGVLRNRAE